MELYTITCFMFSYLFNPHCSTRLLSLLLLLYLCCVVGCLTWNLVKIDEAMFSLPSLAPALLRMLRLKSLLSITMKLAPWFLFVYTLFSSLSSVMRPSPVNDLVAGTKERIIKPVIPKKYPDEKIIFQHPLSHFSYYPFHQ